MKASFHRHLPADAGAVTIDRPAGQETVIILTIPAGFNKGNCPPAGQEFIAPFGVQQIGGGQSGFSDNFLADQFVCGQLGDVQQIEFFQYLRFSYPLVA